MLTAPPGRTAAGRPAASAPAAPEPATVRSPTSRPAATLALAVLTAASSAGLFRIFAGYGWVGPVLATLVVVHLVCWVLRRSGVGPVAAVPAVAVTIALMLSWTVLGRYTLYGLPTLSTWRHALNALGDLHNEFSSMVVPVRPTTAFEIAAAGGAALTAALGDWLALRMRAATAGILPALAAFIFCSVSGQGPGRGAVVGAEVGAMCLFLLVERFSGGDDQIWFAGVRTGTGSSAVLTGGAITAAAVVAAMALSPALAPRDGAGVMGWRSGASGSGERIVPNPLVDLRTRLITHANRPVFLVSSSVPSYWRLTSLDTFDGVTWTSTGSYGGFSSRLPGAPPAQTSVRTVRATFQIEQLDSVWLPAQFDPTAVQGVHDVTYDPQSNSLLTADRTSNGLRYSVTSYQYLDTLNAAALESAPPVPRDLVTAQNLQLPPSVTGRITDLAAQLTTGLTTEYDKALAIQNYLRGPQFTYSLDPPSDGSGTDALSSFLFQTRTGYCQQFAGAFAVLARAAGLPTRLAVGFTQGQAAPGGTFQVLDSDYHTWPEVYFGNRFGWVPFEPTKGFSVPGTSGYIHAGGSPTGPATPTPTTVPTTVPGGKSSTPQSIAKARVSPSSTPTAAAAPRARSGGISAWWLLLPAVVLAWLALAAGVPIASRRLRRRRAARTGTQAVVLDEWDGVMSELSWHDIERRPDETDDEFARRASLALRRLGVGGEWDHGGLPALAAMARQASFAPSVPAGLGDQAGVAAAEILARLAAVTGTRRRVARLWTPPPGTRRRLAESLRRG